MVRQKLSFVGRDIYADWAIALASLAGKAQVEGGFHVWIAPLVANYVTAGHFPEQVCAAASGVLLFARDAEAGAHDAAFVLAAFAYTDTT